MNNLPFLRLATLRSAAGWAQRHWRPITAVALVVYITGPSVELHWQDARPDRCPAGSSPDPRPTPGPTLSFGERYGRDPAAPPGTTRSPSTRTPIPGDFICIGPVPSLTPKPLPQDRSQIRSDSCGEGFALREFLTPRVEGGYLSFYSCVQMIAKPTPETFTRLPAVPAVHQITLRLNNVGIHLLTIGDQYGLEGFYIDR